MKASPSRLVLIGMAAALLGAVGTSSAFAYEGVWTTRHNLPEPWVPNLGQVNGVPYILGGAGCPDEDLDCEGLGPKGRVYRDDQAADSWAVVSTSVPYPTMLGGTAATHGVIVLVGGRTTAGSTARVQEYNPVANSWRQLPPLPQPQYLGETGVDDAGNIWFVHARHLFEFVWGRQVWVTRPAPPIALSDGSASVANGVLYVFSAKGTGASGSVSPGVTEAYTIAAGTWRKRAGSPNQSWQTSAKLGSDGRIYVFGGVSPDDSIDPVRTVEAYDPGANTWFAVTPMNGDVTLRGVARTPTGFLLVGGNWSDIGAPADDVEEFH